MIRKIDIGDYHLRFDTATGFMARWGKTQEDDPAMCPVGPELADVEISTICHGIGSSMETRKPCQGHTWAASNAAIAQDDSRDTSCPREHQLPANRTAAHPPEGYENTPKD